jgi:GPH family glycoside/pentoside/hexuronide:cation symporter
MEELMDEARTASGEKLSLWTKVGFAIGDFGPAVGPGTIVPFFFLFFLTDVVKLNPSLAGVTLLVAKIWDAVNDPIFGFITDRTRTRWGRRRPFILLGAIPFGLTFFLLWVTPPWRDQIIICIHFILLYILFDTAFTAVGVPYNALIPEMTQDYDERTSLVGYVMVVSIGGGLLGAVLPLEIVGLFPDRRFGFAVMGAIMGVAFALPLFATFAVARERKEFQERAALPPLESIRFVVRNRALWYVMGLDILSWLAVDILSAVFIFYLKYWIGMPEDTAGLVLGLVLFSALIFLPLFVKLSQRIEKKWAFVMGMSSWAVIQLGILFVPRGAESLVWVLAFLAGIGVSTAHVMPSSMRPDVLEVDELASGSRQEGIYSGVAVFLRKLSTSLALLGIGVALDWAGYVPEGVQPESALWAIRIIMSPIPALLLTIAIVIAAFYPITREKHKAILEEVMRARTAFDG